MLAWEAGIVAWAVLASFEAVRQGPPTRVSLIMFAALATVASVHLYLTHTAEERRRVARLTREHIDHTGIWTVASALVLPAYLVVLVVLAIRVHRYFVAHKPLERIVFGTAGILGSGLAANVIVVHSPIYGWVTGENQLAAGDLEAGVVLLPWLLLAGCLYFLVQTLMFGVARGLRGSWSWDNTVGTLRENADFLATITFGIVAALLTCISPLLVVLNVAVAVFWTRITKELNDSALESRIDPLLTELYNRRGFDERAEHQLALDIAAGLPSAVLMLDLDHFKRVNDTHGHGAGDDVLRAFARVLREETRQTDLVCRKGGEEIMALLPGTAWNDATTIAERIRVAMADLAVKTTKRAGGEEYTITDLSVSIGVALQPKHGTTITELETRADSAVYTAKNLGRNRVCLASEAEPADDTTPGSSPYDEPPDPASSPTTRPRGWIWPSYCPVDDSDASVGPE